MKKLLLLFFLFSFVQARAQTDSVKHTFIIIGENTSYPQVIGPCPYITLLSTQGANFTKVFATARPSQPNYYNLFCATTAGITSNNDPGARSKNIPSIYTSLNAVGKTTEGYFEGLPSQGSYIFQTGRYYAKHNGFYALSNVPASIMKPLTMLPANLNLTANVVWIVPDINSDGHDTGVLFFDNWLKTNSQMQAIINYCKNPANRSRVVITFDEGGSSSQNIPCVFVGYGVKAGATISTTYNHYNLFNTLIKPYGGQPVNLSVGVPAMTGWETTVNPPPPPPTDTNKCYVSKKDSFLVIAKIDTTWKWNVTTTTVEVPCTTTVDTSIGRIMYMASAHTKIGVASKETIAINYAKQLKCNGYASYNITQISAANFNAFKSKCNANGIKLGAVYGALSEVNYIESSGMKPDFLISENEFWSLAQNNTVAAVTNDSVIRVAAKKLAVKLGITNQAYIGWPGGSTVNQSCSELIHFDDVINIHCYRPSSTGLDSIYVKSRLDQLAPILRREGKKIKIGTIESFETVFFGGGWTRTHSLDEIHPYFKKMIERYGCFEYTQDIFFTDDQLMSVIPYRQSFIARLFSPQYVDELMKGKTLESHIEMSER